MRKNMNKIIKLFARLFKKSEIKIPISENFTSEEKCDQKSGCLEVFETNDFTLNDELTALKCAQGKNLQALRKNMQEEAARKLLEDISKGFMLSNKFDSQENISAILDNIEREVKKIREMLDIREIYQKDHGQIVVRDEGEPIQAEKSQSGFNPKKVIAVRP